MTIIEGLEQDLSDILQDAGNPTFIGWVDYRHQHARLYQFDGFQAVLVTEESEIAITSHQWVRQEIAALNTAPALAELKAISIDRCVEDAFAPVRTYETIKVKRIVIVEERMPFSIAPGF